MMANTTKPMTSPMSSMTRSVTLERTHSQQGFGFSLRGGVEHGIGHFISSVDTASIAEDVGLEAGDQIMSVDGMPLGTVTHKEAVAFISTRNRVSTLLNLTSKCFRKLSRTYRFF